MSSLYRPRMITYRLRDGSYRTPDGKRVTRGMKGAVKTAGVATPVRPSLGGFLRVLSDVRKCEQTL
jgi:hypothetical protein